MLPTKYYRATIKRLNPNPSNYFKILTFLGFQRVVLYVLSQKGKKEIWGFYNYVITVS